MKGNKKILLLGTGGTIAAAISQSGLSPALQTEELLRYCPAIRELCRVDSRQILSLDSTDMCAAHWLLIATAIRDSYNDYDGFVITHGTDTMAYTAAALSYLIQDSQKPVVLTGAQKPIEADTTDSKANLYDSFIIACDENARGVCVVFNGDVILGTRARKVCSKSFRAFSSINYPVVAQVHDGRIIRYIFNEKARDVRFYDALNGNVALLKLYPGLRPEVLKFMLNAHDALVLECFGVGGLPAFADAQTHFKAIMDAVNAGKTIVVTTQVQNEGSDLSLYSVGDSLRHHSRIMEAHDMTTEAALCKLMWILPQTDDADRIRTLFYQPVAMDLLTVKS